jgi:branched-chain amino acid transport system permease protein
LKGFDMRPSGVFDERYEQDLAIVRTKAHWCILVIGLILLFLLPLGTSAHYLVTLNRIGIAIIACQGLSILVGFTGLISMGQAAFMAVGAYTTGIVGNQLGLPFWVTIPLAGLTTGIVGIIFGLPSLRVKGFYLAMATLAAQFIIPWLIDHVRTDITGGADSLVLQPPAISGFTFNTQLSLFYLIMPLAVLIVFLARNIVRSSVGRAFISIRDNDLAAEVMGINLFYYKLLSFFTCSFFAGVAGALWAYWMRSLNTSQFGLMDSIWYLGMIITGGMGSTAGAVFGVLYVTLLDELAQLIAPFISNFIDIGLGIEVALQPIFFGLGVLIFIILEPRGLAHRWEMFKQYYRLWPFSD